MHSGDSQALPRLGVSGGHEDPGGSGGADSSAEVILYLNVF